MGDEKSMTWVTSGKSRVREIRTPGSVRAKPNGIATRPRPSRFPGPALIEPVRFDFLWRPQLRDPDDEVVLETAVNGRSAATAAARLVARESGPRGQFDGSSVSDRVRPGGVAESRDDGGHF